MAAPRYSLIIPVYKNEDSLPALLNTLEGINSELENRLQVIIVVDGSPDRSYELLALALPSSNFESKLLLHSRNFGSFAAIRTGLAVASGEYFAVMAADLQEPPELALEMFTALETNDADIVVGTRERRQDPLPSRIMSNIYWHLYRKLVMPEIPKGGIDVFGCNQKFRESLLELDERHSSLIGLIFWLGFRRKTISYSRMEREHGKSAWTFGKKLNYLMDSVFAFTDLPIKLLIVAGSIGLAFSIIFALLLFAAKLVGVIGVPGYAATVVIILFFGGLNTMGLGIIGAYVWRAYGNTQRRPNAVVMRETSYDNLGNDNIKYSSSE